MVQMPVASPEDAVDEKMIGRDHWNNWDHSGLGRTGRLQPATTATITRILKHLAAKQSLIAG